MRRPKVLLATTFAAALALVAGPAPDVGHAAPLADGVSISVRPSSSEVTLGDRLGITVEVANRSAVRLSDLVVHIDITSLADAGSVDPEDWTSTLSKPIATIDPDGVALVDWQIQPISAGDFTLYAVVLASDNATVAASNAARIVVDDRRSLDPNGILPVSIGATVVVGGLLAFQVRFSRRGRSRPAST